MTIINNVQKDLESVGKKLNHLIRKKIKGIKISQCLCSTITDFNILSMIIL